MMSSFSVNCAGKVFIAGEYTCIEGGSSIVGTLGPEFCLRVTQVDQEHSPKDLKLHPFAENSPAGIYLSRMKSVFENHRIEWEDPYSTPIGVGSSSAQFLLCVAAAAQLQGEALPTAREILSLYWETVGTSQGLRPSGVDVIAQWVGGPVVVRNNPVTIQVLKPWSSSAKFLLAFTGNKTKTHEHLKNLAERGFPNDFRRDLEKLDVLVSNAIEAWNKGDAEALGFAMNSYQLALTNAGLAPLEFTKQLEAVQNCSGVYGAKGSGAQGGDCALLLVENIYLEPIYTKIQELGWTPIHVSWNSDGVHFEKNFTAKQLV